MTRKRKSEQTAETAAFDASAPALRPSDRLRERVLGAKRGTGRYEGFVDRIARCLRIAEAEARALLAAAERAESWKPGRCDGVTVIDVPSAHVRARLVRAEPGARVALHEHKVPELAFCIQGGADQLNGSSLDPGDFEISPPGQRHGYLSVGDEPCILLLCRPR